MLVMSVHWDNITSNRGCRTTLSNTYTLTNQITSSIVISIHQSSKHTSVRGWVSSGGVIARTRPQSGTSTQMSENACILVHHTGKHTSTQPGRCCPQKTPFDPAHRPSTAYHSHTVMTEPRLDWLVYGGMEGCTHTRTAGWEQAWWCKCHGVWGWRPVACTEPWHEASPWYPTAHHITSHHFTSHHITSHHITSLHITLCHAVIPPQQTWFWPRWPIHPGHMSTRQHHCAVCRPVKGEERGQKQSVHQCISTYHDDSNKEVGQVSCVLAVVLVWCVLDHHWQQR